MKTKAIHVLLVEDDPADAQLAILSSRRKPKDAFHFTVAHTLGEALERLAAETFDVALLDLSLPDAFGLEAVAKVRAAKPGLPIVVLTGNDDDELALRALQQGAQDYLVKNFENSELISRAVRYAIERSRSESDLRHSEGQLRAIFENAGLGIALIAQDGHVVSANPALEAMLGEDLTAAADPRLSRHLAPEDRDEMARQLERLLAERVDRFAIEARIAERKGKSLWVYIVFSLVREANGNPPFILAMVEDISARKALEEQQLLAAKVLEATSEGIYVTTADGIIVHVNPAFTTLTGYEPQDVLGRKASVLSSGRHGRDFYSRMWRSLLEQGFWRGELWNRRKSGEIFAEWLDVSAVKNNRGGVEHYVGVFSDITARKESEERLSHLANHDPLTGLPNRTLFGERLERAINRAERNHLRLAVLFLDLDHFKDVNDTLGHMAGDLLLRHTSERLRHSVRREDTVARLGGDEFTLLLEDIGDFRDAATVARKVLRSFATPFDLGDGSRQISTSIGISLYPEDGREVEILLAGADEAMYAAKKQGRGSFRFASKELSRKAFERDTLEASLGRAVSQGEMEVFYQPFMDLAKGTAAGAEALLRWHHPEIGMMVPPQFMTLATDSGHVVPIGRWMLSSALATAAQWPGQDGRTLGVCVNFSATELSSPGLIEAVRYTLERLAFPAARLEIDVPLVFARDTPGRIGELRALGVRLALDDFTGEEIEDDLLNPAFYSRVKLAGGLVRGLGATATDEKRVATLIERVHGRGLAVLAKGVETTAQWDFLSHHRCDGAQGYLFGRPVPAMEFGALLPRLSPSLS